LTLDQWEKDGQKHSKHRVTVETFTFVGPAAGSAPQPKRGDAEPVPDQINQDDIPF